MPWRENIDVDQIADHIEDESMIVGTEEYDDDINEDADDEDVEELNFDDSVVVPNEDMDDDDDGYF